MAFMKSVKTLAMERAAEQESEDSFNLNEAIGRLYEETNIADPSKLTELLLPSIPVRALHALARKAVRDHVRQWLRVARRNETTDFRSKPKGAPAAVRKFVRSIKLDAYARILAERYHVGPKHTDWKVLGDCKEADLSFVVEERKSISARNLHVATRVEHLITSLRKHKAVRVRDLPKDAVLAFREEGE